MFAVIYIMYNIYVYDLCVARNLQCKMKNKTFFVFFAIYIWKTKNFVVYLH